MNIGYTEALMSLRPNSSWVLRGTEYEEIEWLDNANQKPTETEVQAEVSRLQAEYDAKDYQRKRAQAYPSIADQLDILYHSGFDAWKSAIQAVKETYPK